MRTVNYGVSVAITFVAFALNVFTAFLLDLIYFAGIENIRFKFDGTIAIIPYFTTAPIALVLLIVANQLSAKYRPPHWFYRWGLDFTGSVALFANVAFVFVLALIKVFADVNILSAAADVSLSLLSLLVALLIWSSIDIIFNQMKNYKERGASGEAVARLDANALQGEPLVTLHERRQVLVNGGVYERTASGDVPCADLALVEALTGRKPQRPVPPVQPEAEPPQAS